MPDTTIWYLSINCLFIRKTAWRKYLSIAASRKSASKLGIANNEESSNFFEMIKFLNYFSCYCTLLRKELSYQKNIKT